MAFRSELLRAAFAGVGDWRRVTSEDAGVGDAEAAFTDAVCWTLAIDDFFFNRVGPGGLCEGERCESLASADGRRSAEGRRIEVGGVPEAAMPGAPDMSDMTEGQPDVGCVR